MRQAGILLFCVSLFSSGLMRLAGAWEKPVASTAKADGFAADVAGVDEGAPVSGRIYFTPDRFRMERSEGGAQTILIMDRKKKMMWIIHPGNKTYVEIALNGHGVSVSMPFPDESGKPCAPMKATSCTRSGQEMVNGRQCDRWELTASSEDETVKTTLWLDPVLGAPIRWQTDTGDHYDFTNIKIGAQPESLFQVPTGFKKNQ